MACTKVGFLQMASQNGAIILAAGKGTRMKTEKPKVMCEVLGKPMVDYVLSAVKNSCEDICVVIGYKADILRNHLPDDIKTVIQSEQLGTGHAVMQANEFIQTHSDGNILIACGDTPLIDEKTIADALKLHIQEDNAVTVITARLCEPASYGRIVKQNGKISEIVEFKDASDEIRKINEVNSGIYWFKGSELYRLLNKITNNNAQKEYYLTDTIKIALAEGLSVNSFVAENEDIILGANDPKQLDELNKRAEKYFSSGSLLK